MFARAKIYMHTAHLSLMPIFYCERQLIHYTLNSPAQNLINCELLNQTPIMMKPADPLNLYMHFKGSSASSGTSSVNIIGQLKAKSQTLEFEKETGSIPTEAPSLCSSQQCESSTLTTITNGGDQKKTKKKIKKKQAEPYRDILFFILFVAHLAVLALAAYHFGQFIYDIDGDEDNGVYITLDFKGVMYTLVCAFVFSSVLAASVLRFLLKYTSLTLKLALTYNAIISLAVAYMGFSLKSVPIIIAGIGWVLYAICLCTRRVELFEFATSNFRVALLAVQNNMALLLVAIFSLIILFLFTCWWSIATVGVINTFSAKCEDGICEGSANDTFKGTSLVFVLFLMISFVWTQQVIKNVVHVTVAGTVGLWYFEKKCEEQSIRNSWRSRDVKKAFILSVTRLFGSVCVGSLLMTVFHLIRRAVKKEDMKNDREEDSYRYRCGRCIDDCFGGIIQCAHDWAYTFVGLYGYSFLEAGSAVSDLFNTRGWTAVVSDCSVGVCLLMMNTFVSFTTSILCLGIATIYPQWFSSMDENVGSLAAV